jgi:hypothetical protein
MPAPRPFALPLAACLSALLAFAPRVTNGQTAQLSQAGLEAENARLARLLELASGREFYLLLDLERGQLHLMYRGAVLRDFLVLDTQVGRRRAFFTARPLPADWADSVWHDGRLHPGRRFERLELDAPDSPVPPESLTVTIPPTPEEAIPAPDRFLIRYRDGKAIEIVAHDTSVAAGDARPPRASTPLGERLLYVLAPWRRPAVLIRLEMPAEDAQALYRGLPEDGEFLLVPATPRRS